MTERRLTVRLKEDDIRHLDFVRTQAKTSSSDSAVVKWALEYIYLLHAEEDSKGQRLERIEMQTEPTPRIEMKVDAILELMQRGSVEGKTQISAAEIPGCLRRDK